MSKKLTYQEVKEYIESFGYKLLSKEYIKNSIKLKMICDKGHVCEISYNNFKTNKRRCPECSGNKKYTYEEIKRIIEEEEEGYRLLSTEYKNSNEYIIVSCPNENHEPYPVTFSAFNNGKRRCPKCKNKKISQTNMLPYEKIKEIVEIENYNFIDTKFKTDKSGKRNRYIKVQCDNNHNPYWVRLDSFKQGQRCPYCNESKGEKEVTRVLDKLNINYIQQYKFNDCKCKRELPFDFYLPNYNICIEYDGEGHYAPFRFSKNKDKNLNKFIETIIHDTIKTDYCKKNNIKLIRIPYWDFDKIEKILKLELNL